MRVQATQIGLKFKFYILFFYIFITKSITRLLIPAILFGIFISSANAKINIIVEGNQRIDAQIIKSYIDRTITSSKPSDLEIDDALKKLLKSNLFLDARIYRKDKSLVIEVSENPIISEVKLSGNDKIGDDVLLNELSLKKRGVFSKFKLRSDLKRINDIYIKSGRYLAKIEPKLIQKEGNRIEIIFDIKEGPRAKISKILFVGNNQFSDSELIEQITTRESKWYKPFSSSDVYDSDKIEFDREKLRRFYGSVGYADFSTVSSVAQISKNKEKFFVTILMQEGIKYNINEVQIDNRIENFNEDLIKGEIDIETGDLYNSEKIEKNIEKSIEDDDELMSEALAELLVNQGNNVRAIKMYQHLILKFPEKKTFFAQKIKDLS